MDNGSGDLDASQNACKVIYDRLISFERFHRVRKGSRRMNVGGRATRMGSATEAVAGTANDRKKLDCYIRIIIETKTPRLFRYF